MCLWMLPILAFWLVLPAYVANPSAVFFGGGVPVDFGRKLQDGKRFLGDGKTWSGTFGGIFCGYVLGLIQLILALALGLDRVWYWGGIYPALILLLILPAGSLFGDMLGSYIKRRMNRQRGARTPILDQYDFVIGTFLFLFILYPAWTWANFFAGDRWIGLLVLLLGTYGLHRGVNIIGYKMGKKNEPW